MHILKRNLPYWYSWTNLTPTHTQKNLMTCWILNNMFIFKLYEAFISVRYSSYFLQASGSFRCCLAFIYCCFLTGWLDFAVLAAYYHRAHLLVLNNELKLWNFHMWTKPVSSYVYCFHLSYFILQCLTHCNTQIFVDH